jgi:hypothetical protein
MAEAGITGSPIIIIPIIANTLAVVKNSIEIGITSGTIFGGTRAIQASVIAFYQFFITVH